MTTTSRRALLAGATAIPLASVAALASTGATSGDAKLRHLWAEYLAHADAYAAAQEKYIPARAAFDAECPPCPDDMCPGDRWQACKPLWHKHGLDTISDALTAADDAMSHLVPAILRTDAEGLFGIGVKLAAMGPGAFIDACDHDVEDYEEAVAAACADIDRMIGSDFAERLADRGVMSDDEAAES